MFGKGNRDRNGEISQIVPSDVVELDIQQRIGARQTEIDIQCVNDFGKLVAERMAFLQVRNLVETPQGVPVWSQALLTEIEDCKQIAANEAAGKKIRETGNQGDVITLWDWLNRTEEAAIVEGLNGRLNTMIHRNETFTGDEQRVLQTLPVRDPVLLQEEIDYWRKTALQHLTARRDVQAFAHPDAIAKASLVFGNVLSKNPGKVEVDRRGYTPQGYKLAALHAGYATFKGANDEYAAQLLEELASNALSDRDGRPYSLSSYYQAGRDEKMVMEGAQMRAVVKENFGNISSFNARRAAAAVVGVGLTVGSVAGAHPAAAASGPNIVSSSAPTNLVFPSANGNGIKVDVVAAGFAAPEMVGTGIAPMSVVSAGVAAPEMVEAVAPGQAPALHKVDVVRTVVDPNAKVTPEMAAKNDIAGLAAQSPILAAAELVNRATAANKAPAAGQPEQPGVPVEKQSENPLISEALAALAESEMQKMSTSTLLSAEDAVINQQYLAYLIAGAQSPASLNLMDPQAKKAVLEGLLTDSPEAMQKLAAKYLSQYGSAEYGSWAGYTKDQQRLVSALIATIDVSMMSQEQLNVLAPPKPEAAPTAPSTPEVPTVGRISVNEAEVKADQRSAVVKQLRLFGVPSDEIAGYYIDFSAKYKVPLELLVSQGKQESGFRDDVITGRYVNRVGAKGISQFMDPTWEQWKAELGFPEEASPFMPRYAIEAQAAMMKAGLRKAKGNVPLALAGYNAGWGNVAKYGGVPPFGETRTYIKRISKSMGTLKTSITSAENKVRNDAIQKVRQANERAAEQERLARQKAEAERIAAEKAAAEKAAAERAQQEQDVSRSNERDPNVEIVQGPVSAEGWGLPISAKAYKAYGDGAEYLGYKKIKANHDGKDYAVPEGTRVLAPRAGVVDYVGYYGNTSILVVVIDHGIINGRHIQTNYEHVSEFKVKKGDRVQLGQVIAQSVNTGADQG